MQRSAPTFKTPIQLAGALRLVAIAEDLIPLFEAEGFMHSFQADAVRRELSRLKALINREEPRSRAEWNRIARQLAVVNDLISLYRERLTGAQARMFARARAVYIGAARPKMV